MLRKDPLIHFLVVGGCLFAALSWFGRSEPSAGGERILVSAEDVAAIARSAELLQGRPPTDSELEALVEDAVRDEVYYRRALMLGLDVDDDEVRRRLIEKMQYLTENTADPEPPDSDLEAYFAANAERFRIPALATFEQVFFSPRMRGEEVLADAEAALVELRQGADPQSAGDSTPLPARFDAADPDRIRVLFGDELTDIVFREPLDLWLGPFESDFGWHLVRIAGRTEARDPEFAEVESLVREAYAAEMLDRANRAAFNEMLSYFDVRVQWQAGAEPASWP
ncbi:MAG: peptidylprolyl isomerase [Gammaproteobacteria bacterium]|jgi:hypothetical protein